MAAGNVLGRAYIEIHADTKPFAKELGVEVEAIAKAAAGNKKVRSAGEKLGNGVADGFGTSIRKRLPKVFGDIAGIVNGREGRRISRAFARLGEGAAETFTDALKGIGKGLAGIIPAIGSSIGNVSSQGPLGLLVGLAVISLIPAIAALLNVLGPLINGLILLPGLAGVAVAAIVPLVAAFHGFGEALGAVMANDPERLNAALKNLTPSARKVVLEFQKMVPLFTQLRQAAQESFFKELIGDLPAIQKVLGPTLVKGFSLVAASAGKFADSLLKLFASPSGQAFFESMFYLADQFFATIGPGLTSILKGIMDVAVASAPGLGTLFDDIGAGLKKFGEFLSNLASNGRVNDLIDKFRDALSKLKDLALAGWNMVKSIIGSTSEGNAAQEFFDTILEVFKTMTDFFKSDEGRRGMKNLVALAGLLFIVLFGIVGLLVTMASWIDKIVEGMKWIIDHVNILPKPGSNLNPDDKAKFDELVKRGSPHASGTITTGPEMALIGEAGPEVVIPLNDPRRARQLVNQSGLMDVIGGGGGGDVNVYIGNEKIDAHVERVQAQGFRAFGRGMKYGPRFATAGV